MMQSRVGSAVEAWMNTLSGFLISWAMWVYIVAPLYGFDNGHIKSLSITMIFTASSMTRSYLVRRVFNNGWHKASHWIATKLERESGPEEQGSAHPPTCYSASLQANDPEA